MVGSALDTRGAAGAGGDDAGEPRALSRGDLSECGGDGQGRAADPDDSVRLRFWHQVSFRGWLRRGRAMMNASYNDIAEWYDQFLRERPVYQEVILPNLLRLVGEVEGEVICDLACGQGWVARELARRGARVTGLDLAANMLALARGYEEQEPLGIVYVQGDAQRAEPLGDRQFTGCVCVMALINIPDLQATFQSVRRILQPGGWF